MKLSSIYFKLIAVLHAYIVLYDASRKIKHNITALGVVTFVADTVSCNITTPVHHNITSLLGMIC